MKNFNLYVGKILSLNDSDNVYRLQIKLLPEYKDIPDDDCPWLPPFFKNNMKEYSPPSEDSLVWVLYDEYFQEGYYIPGYYVSGLIDFSEVSDILNGASDTGINDYEDLKFTLEDDGSLSYINRSTGERGIIQSTGTYVIIESNGDVTVKTSNQVKIYNDTTSLKSILTDIQTVLKNIVTPLNWIDSRSGPVTYTGASGDLTTLTTVLTNIDSLLKD